MPDPRAAPEPRWSLPPERKAEILAEIEAQARKLMATVTNPVHDFKHVQRVRLQARRAAVELGVDPDLADLAALLHDLGRAIEHDHPGANHGDLSAKMAGGVLKRYEDELPAALQTELLHALRGHSRLGCDRPLLAALKEADALDALGALGIVRAIATRAEGPDYDPARPRETPPGDDPLRIRSMTDQLHFQMGLLREVQTPGGLALARERVAFMQTFWDRLWNEILGQDGQKSAGE